MCRRKTPPSPLLRSLGLTLLVALALGCNRTADESDQQTTRASSPIKPAPGVGLVPGTGDQWGPLVSLRDTTETWSEGRPEDGWHVAAIHAVLLGDGDVLITGWARRDPSQCQMGGTRAHGLTFRLSPDELSGLTTGVDQVFNVSPIDELGALSSDVLYCAGHNPLADGRIFYTGGSRYENLGQLTETEFGLNYARLYDPSTDNFTRIEDPMMGGPAGQEGKRWYPTNTRLPDSKVLVTGGFYRYGGIGFVNLSVEVFDPEALGTRGSAWREVISQEAGLETMAPAALDYTHVYVLPTPVTDAGGKEWPMLMVGDAGIVHLFDPGEGATSGVYSLPAGGVRGSSASGATGALLPSGEILVGGGSNDPITSRAVSLYSPHTDTWREIDSGIGRYHSTSVLLPNGKVLLINGGRLDGFLGDSRSPQILDPETEEITTYDPWADDALERGYHSFALMLQDGRILLGGGIDMDRHTIGCERTDLRLYEPAYLHRGPRPVIQGVDGAQPALPGSGTLHRWELGSEVSLELSGPPLKDISGVVLMATGAITHAFDQNQRYLPLEIVSSSAPQSPSTLVVKTPATAVDAPPGDYNLFLVSEAGVPSVGVSVRIVS